MIRELLLPYNNTPGLRIPELKDRAVKRTAKVKKAINVMVKRAERKVTLAARRQYLLTAATRDLRGAIKRNEDIIIAGIAGMFVLAYGIALTAMEFLILAFEATFDFSETTGLNSGLLTFTAGSVLLVLAVLLLAFLMNFMSIAVMDGANRKIHRSIRSTTRQSLRTASRTAGAWCLLGAVHFGRVMLVMTIGYAYVKWGLEALALPPPVLVAVGTAAVLWIFAGVIRYSLMPYVALFEPQLLLSHTFERSRRLVRKQGWPFLIMMYTLMGAFLTALYAVTEPITKAFGAGINLLFYVGVVMSVLVANGAMVMLYVKRKRARTL